MSYFVVFIIFAITNVATSAAMPVEAPQEDKPKVATLLTCTFDRVAYPTGKQAGLNLLAKDELMVLRYLVSGQDAFTIGNVGASRVKIHLGSQGFTFTENGRSANHNCHLQSKNSPLLRA